MENTQQQPIDQLNLLPTNKNAHPQKEVLLHVFNSQQGDDDDSSSSFSNEVKDIIFSIVLFILVSAPFMDTILEKKAGTNKYIHLVIKALLFAFVYYVVKYTFIHT
jgi:hypothetical protein